MDRLDRHGDRFRTISVEVEARPEVAVRAPRPAGKTSTPAKQTEKPSAAGGKKPATKRKSKGDKVSNFQ